MVLFVTLPVLTFFIGIEYQKKITYVPQEINNNPKLPTSSQKVVTNQQYSSCSQSVITDELSGTTFVCPRGWEMLNSPIGNYQFRLSSDQTPAISGFALSLQPNPSNLTLSQTCDLSSSNPKTAFEYLCSDSYQSSVSIVNINGLSWEKFKSDTIGIVPTGYVVYAAAKNKYLISIENYSADLELLDNFVQTISTTK